jgi:hypothetical protein
MRNTTVSRLEFVLDELLEPRPPLLLLEGTKASGAFFVMSGLRMVHSLALALVLVVVGEGVLRSSFGARNADQVFCLSKVLGAICLAVIQTFHEAREKVSISH